MKVSEMIRKLEAMEPEAELRFFKFEEAFFGEYERTQIFVEDISASQEGEDSTPCVEILLG